MSVNAAFISVVCVECVWLEVLNFIVYNHSLIRAMGNRQQINF